MAVVTPNQRTSIMPEKEHFRCDECGRVVDDPPTALTNCQCGGRMIRYVRANLVGGGDTDA